jgi:hypothetical protein
MVVAVTRCWICIGPRLQTISAKAVSPSGCATQQPVPTLCGTLPTLHRHRAGWIIHHGVHPAAPVLLRLLNPLPLHTDSAACEAGPQRTKQLGSTVTVHCQDRAVRRLHHQPPPQHWSSSCCGRDRDRAPNSWRLTAAPKQVTL